MGNRVIALCILDLDAWMGWVVRTTPRPLHPRERSGTHCTGGWVGPRAGLNVCEKYRFTGIRSPDRLARCQSLYRLSCPAHAINILPEDNNIRMSLLRNINVSSVLCVYARTTLSSMHSLLTSHALLKCYRRNSALQQNDRYNWCLTRKNSWL
jgi:hypothetical protein